MADPRQRYEDPIEAYNAAWDGRQAEVWTALPGIVQSVNFNNTEDGPEVTATIQPAIQARVTAQDGTQSFVNLPLLIHVPVVFPRGGGISITFPLAADDEVLVVFASRCIDGWWSQGGIQPQAEFRMHDLSDGFCIPGVYSQPNVISNISDNSVQIRTDDGKAFLELTQDYDVNITTAGGTVQVTTTDGGDLDANIDGALTATVKGDVSVDSQGDEEVTANNITLNGNVKVNGTLQVTEATTLNSTLETGSVTVNGSVEATGDGTFGIISVEEHVHTSAAPGSPTSPPLP